MEHFNIVKDISNMASDVRHKANYMRLRPRYSTEWNYEQKQTAVEVLEELAAKLENLVAEYFIVSGYIVGTEIVDEELAKSISRQCKTAVRRAVARKNATLGG